MYTNIAEDVETRFKTTNYELNRSLPKGKNKKVVNVIKDGLGAKTYSYLINYDSKKQNARDTQKSMIMKTVQEEFNKVKAEWILYFRILKIVKLQILIDYYSNSQALELECCFIKSDYLLCIEKYKKSHAKTTNLKILGQRGLQNLNYLINHILYQIFKTILSILSKSMKNLLIIFQQEYMEMKQKTVLRLE